MGDGENLINIAHIAGRNCKTRLLRTDAACLPWVRVYSFEDPKVEGVCERQ
jgi:hypothetical protein